MISSSLRLCAINLLILGLAGCAKCQPDGRIEHLRPQPVAPPPIVDVINAGSETHRPDGVSVHIQELELIFFDFDSADISADAAARLERNAEWFRDNPTISLLIEGHCDSRGTDGYNYNLGQERATAVMTYLRRLGIPNRMATRSFGETRPECEDETEACWARNRRVQFSAMRGN